MNCARRKASVSPAIRWASAFPVLVLLALWGGGLGCRPMGRQAAEAQPPAFADDFASGDLSRWDYAEGKPAFGPAASPRVVAPAKQTVTFGRKEPMASFALRSEVRLPAEDPRVHLRFLYAGKGNQWRGYLLSLTRKGQDPFTIQCRLQVSQEEGKPVRDLGSQSLVFGTADDKRMEHWTKYAGAPLAARWKAVVNKRFEAAAKGLPLEVSVAGRKLSVVVNHHLVFRLENWLPAGGVQFELSNAAELAAVRLSPPEPSSPFLAVDLAPLYNRHGISGGGAGSAGFSPSPPARSAGFSPYPIRPEGRTTNAGDLRPEGRTTNAEGGDLGDGTAIPASALPPADRVASIEGVPFRMPSYADGALNVVDVGDSRWLESRDDGYRCRSYLGMRPGDGNPASLRVAVPRDWYRAAWLLCLATEKSADVDTETIPEVTLRLGSFGYPFRLCDFAATVPVWRGKGKPFVVRVPLNSGDLDTLMSCATIDSFDLELTKRIQSAVHFPDPYQFVQVPLGPSSAVKVVALTLERSPVTMYVSPQTTGNAFLEPAKPGVSVVLSNRSDRSVSIRLGGEAIHYFGRKSEIPPQRVRIKPHETRDVILDLPAPERGHYDLTLHVSDADGPLVTKHTSYCLLARDTRKAMEDSPFGLWTFWGGHGFPKKPEGRDDYYVRLMDMLYKAGIRYTFPLTINVPESGPPEEKARLQASADRIRRELHAHKILTAEFRPPGTFHPLWDKKRYDDPWPGKSLADSMAAIGRLKKATECDRAELFAEDRISVRWLMQVPWWWQGKPRPAYDERERRNLDALVRVASIWIDELRKQHPDVKVLLGNDYPLQIEALLNEGFVKKGYVDIVGIEGAQFMRMPENPTFLTVTAFTRQMREALDMHGGQKVPIWSTEAFYPCTHPGNLTERTQARYVARTLLVGLAAGLEKVLKPFGIYDMSDDYRFSHWGMPGLCRDDDEFQPKPSYVAYAVLTQVLDRCKFARNAETGSPVVFAPVFRRVPGAGDGRDGHEVCALWTLHGTRPATITVSGGTVTLTDVMGRETRPALTGGTLQLTLTPDPLYVAGAPVQKIALGEAVCSAGLSPSPPARSAGFSPYPPARSAGFSPYPPARSAGFSPYPIRPEGRTTNSGEPTGKAQVISELASADEWLPAREGEAPAEPPRFLEENNFENPRVKGEFKLDWGRSDPRMGKCLAVTMPPLPADAKDPLIARYQALELKKKAVLDGRPRWIGAWVKGCGNWGRLIYDLTDAEGERWISIGMPREFNASDPYNWSFLNHDGWRFVRHDLPGDFGGSERHHWPTQCIWGHFKPGPPDKEGKPTDAGNGIVDYPLTFNRLVLEMRDTVICLDSYRHIADNTILVKGLMAGEE